MRQPLTKGVTIALFALSAAALVVPFRAYCDNPPEEWKAPARAARKKNPIPADEKSLAAGKIVYAAQCASCHGPAGHGDGLAAKDLNPKPRNLSDSVIQSQTDGSIYWKLSEGRKPMPTFEKLIPENDRWHVINYVRTLAAPGGK
jgi:mono/diheme cytochrome c family protein